MKKYPFLLTCFVVLLSLQINAQTINWEKKFSSARTGRSVQTLADGGYIATGGYQIGSVIRTNAQGDSLWGKNFGDATNSTYLYTIKSVSGGYIVSGSNNGKPYVMKIDLNGTKVWEHYVGGPAAYGEVFSFVPVADGIVCTGYLFAGSNRNMLLAKLSLNGDSLWMKSITPHTTTSGRAVTSMTGNFIISSSNAFVITGIADTEIYLFKMDASGNRLWDRCYGGIHSTSDNDEGKSVQQTADDGFIICGGKALSNTKFNTEITLTKTTSDGTLTWQKSVPGSGGYGYEIIVENDGYVLVGNLGGSARMGYIFKTDLQGTVVFNKLLGVQYAYGLDKATNGSYIVTGTYTSPNTMYLGNVLSPTPQRYFVIRDVNNSPIANKDVVFYKGTMSPGNDTRIISQKTDANGKVLINPTWYDEGDNVRAVITVLTVPTQKPLHMDTIIQGVAYRVMLDNVKFDERNSLPLTNVIFEEYDSDPSVLEQQLTLDHTTIMFDLLISIEWDADISFTNEMKSGLMLASNYLYDVFDGQVALGKVAIYDDKVSWNGADICYTGSSETWPNAGIKGYLNSKIGSSQQVLMPPRWFGSPDLTRDSSVKDNWLTQYVDNTWRTFSHELGHQLLGFYDEYSDAIGNTINDNYNLGFMDSQYPDAWYYSNVDKIYSSELSSNNRYRTEDKKNRQFLTNRTDCWTYFEQQFEKTHNGVYCPIDKPSERSTLATGTSWLIGPNDKSYSGAPYNAGSMLKTTVIDKNTVLSESVLAVYIPATPTNISAGLVQTYLKKKSTGRVIDLGLTSLEGGQKRFLGAEKGDGFTFAGNVGGKKNGQAVSLNGTISSSYKKGDETIMAMDTNVTLNIVKGLYRIVPIGSLAGANNFNLKLKINNSFTQMPTAETPHDYSPSEQSTFTLDAGNNIYQTQIDSLPMSGPIFVTGYDEASNSFIIPLSYSTTTFSTDIFGDKGAALLLLDSMNASSIQKVTIISSGFATLLTGLDPDVEQAGNVHSIIINPSSVTLMGNNALTIRYSNSDLSNNSASSLQIFKWNEATSIWEKIGGSVDTVHNEVNAKITSAGTYAAFTTGSSTGVLEEDGKIQDITLSSVSGSSGTMVHLDLPRRENITLSITNSLGILITTLASGELTAGGHDFQMNTTTLPSGIYFCTAKTMSTTKTIKIMVIK